LNWVAASGIKGATRVTLGLTPERVVATASAQAPVINGQLTDTCWDGQYPVCMYDNTDSTDVFLRYDATNLYIGCRRTAPTAQNWAVFTNNMQLNWHVFIGDRTNVSSRYVHLEVEANGTRSDYLRTSPVGSEDETWNGSWTCSIVAGNSSTNKTTNFVAEFAIPLTTLSGVGLDTGNLIFDVRGATWYGGATTWFRENGYRSDTVHKFWAPLALDVPCGEMNVTRPYTVRLHFAEVEGATAGQRRFDVKLQGNTVLSDFDIFATAGGQDRAVVMEFTGIQAKDDLVIDLVPIVGEPLICGVEVVAGASAPTPPTITSAATASAMVGQAFNYTITASGTTPITFGASGLPAGLSRSGALISGTPTTAGTNNVTLTATNSAGADTNTLVVTILPANFAPTVATVAEASPSTVTGTNTALTVLGEDDGGEAALTYTWTMTGTPPAPVTFSTNGNNAAKNCAAIFTKVGSYSLQVVIRDAGNLAVTSSVPVTVSQTLTSVTVVPASANVAINETQSFTATGRDQFAAALTNQPAFAWEVSGGGTINSSGLFTAGVTVGGPHTVTATNGGKSGAASVTVTLANVAPTVATAATASPDTVTGAMTTLSVMGADDGGEANLTYKWSATGTPPAPVFFSANDNNLAKNCAVSFDAAGGYSLQVEIKDAGNLAVTSSVAVTVNATLTTIAVTPVSASVAMNDTEQFAASAYDQFGGEMGVVYEWFVTGGGTIDAAGLFTAGGTAGGPHTVAAMSGGTGGVANVTVTDGAIYYVGGEDPGSGTWMSGEWSNFVAQLSNLSEGDELRVAGTITKSSAASATNATANTTITGGWEGGGGGWWRKDISKPWNRSVLDGSANGNLLCIAATNVTVEGIVLKKGKFTWTGLLGANLKLVGNGARIEHCSILDSDKGADGATKGGGIYIQATNVVVKHCVFSGNNVGGPSLNGSGGHLYITGSDKVRFTECEFTATGVNATNSIYLVPGSNKAVTFDNCLFYNDKLIYSYNGSNTFINVTMHNVGLKVLDSNANDVFIRNCILSECGNFVVHYQDAQTGSIVINDSLIDNLSSQTNRTGLTVTKDAETLDIDAGHATGFTATNNFTLTAASAATNLGDNVWLAGTYQGAILGLTDVQQTDFAGNSRVNQTKCDAGAYEFQAVSADSDTDSMPDTWETTNFGSTNAVDGGAEEDYDHDGMRNLAEYIAGTCPTNAGDLLKIADVSPDESSATGMVIRWSSVAGKWYAIQTATNLMNGFDGWAKTNIPATPEMNTYTVIVDQIRSRYYRVIVE
jgi:hypothetical protein